MGTIERLSVPSDVVQLAVIRDTVERFCEEQEMDPGSVMKVLLSVDEAATNVVMHGYEGTTGQIEVELEAADGGVILRLRDTAPAFDPLSIPPPDLDVPLEERQIGGLGIHLIRNSMDEVSYRRTEAGENELTMVKRPAHRSA